MGTLEQLYESGLNETEAKVYLYVLENGLTSPPVLAKGTGVLRTNCYNVLQSLQAKGLIEEHKKGTRKAYLASDPAALLRALEKKKEATERLLPDLRALYTTQKNKPKVRFYDGLEEVKEIYAQVVTAEEVFGIGSIKSLASLDPAFWLHILKEYKKNNVIFHDILTNVSAEKESEEMQRVLGGLYDFRLLPKEEGDQPTDTLIFGDNVALITLQEPIFGTVLTSPLLAKTFRVMWRTMHRSLRS